MGFGYPRYELIFASVQLSCPRVVLSVCPRTHDSVDASPVSAESVTREQRLVVIKALTWEGEER